MPWNTSRHPGSTRQSRTERATILTMWPICYLRYPGCTIRSTEDEHVVPLSSGGTNDIGNRRGACHHCHGIKTRTEAAAARPRRTRPTEPHPGLNTPPLGT